MIKALTDALGNLGRFILLPGHRYETVGVPPLIGGLKFRGLIANMAFDSNAIIADLNQRGARGRDLPSIHAAPRPLLIDDDIYKWRHLIANFFFGKLKEFKRIAMKADKTDQSFTAAIYLAAELHPILIGHRP